MDGRDRIMALREAHRRLAQAQEGGDVATLNSLLTPGYKHTDRRGKLWFREEWLAQVRPEPKPPAAMDFGGWSAVLRSDLES